MARYPEAIARYERMRKALELMDRGDNSVLRQVISESPPQSLREIRAEAGREGFRVGAEWAGRMGERFKFGDEDAEADQYAQQIKSGE